MNCFKSWKNQEHLKEFLYLLPELCKDATACFVREPSLLRLSSPTYVLGDIHGNYKDLQFFANSFWKFGLNICPASVLFLGDYVDRGPHSVETIAYLLALKIENNSKCFLLRGNHESSEVNGDISNYKSTSFKMQCMEWVKDESLWRAFNECFFYLPLAAV